MNASGAKEYTITEARFGQASDWLSEFGFYQVKAKDERGRIVVLPAYGPGAFTKMRWWLPITLVVLGGITLHPSRKVK